MEINAYWIWLNEIKGIGPVIGKKLLEKFNTPENIFKASYDDLISVEGVGNKIAKTIVESKDKTMSRADSIIKKCIVNGIKILNMNDELYPLEVKKLKDSPILLYYLGNIRKEPLGVGIVGSRRCTDYGKRIAKEAAEFLCENNIPVISGMAKGIDGYSHTACVNAGRYTMAFLGCGVDIVYPKEHLKLMEKIIEIGAVVSEYPPGTEPDPKNFPKRNRLISAFSKKLLVIEASRSSGSLITAEFAKKYGRQVFAVPNNIFSTESIGTNELILNGSTIYVSSRQLLDKPLKNIENYEQNHQVQAINSFEIDPIEKLILNAVSKEPKTIDELNASINNTRTDILEKLSLMELQGKVRIFRGKVQIWNYPRGVKFL